MLQKPKVLLGFALDSVGFAYGLFRKTHIFGLPLFPKPKISFASALDTLGSASIVHCAIHISILCMCVQRNVLLGSVMHPLAFCFHTTHFAPRCHSYNGFLVQFALVPLVRRNRHCNFSCVTLSMRLVSAHTWPGKHTPPLPFPVRKLQWKPQSAERTLRKLIII